MPDTAIATAAKPIPDFSRLTLAEESLILQLANEGKSQTAIAQVLGCSQPTVSRVIHAFTDTREHAKRILHNGAAKLATKVVDASDVDQALEVLDRLDVAPKRVAAAGAGVNILIGMPGQAIGPDVIVLPQAQNPGNDNAHYETQKLSEGQ